MGCCYVGSPTGSFRSAALKDLDCQQTEGLSRMGWQGRRGIKNMGEGLGRKETGRESGDSAGTESA